VDVNDAGEKREGVVVYGAFGVGNFKTKLHKACVARLFTRNDLVLDAEAIADVARGMVTAKKG
jgi:methylenetetrahydrofolate/methylenetetrahydromethanopterin dehydrogenase (NADP+)